MNTVIMMNWMPETAGRTSVTAKVLGAAFALLLISGMISLQTAEAGITASLTDDGQDLVKAALITETRNANPGETILAGVHLEMEKDWYIYWQNPGDSGIPTSIQWELPDGYSAGDLKWPYPTNFFTDSFVSHGYKEDVVLMAELNIPEDAKAGDKVSISASVNWLVCKDVCIPGRADVTTEISIGDVASGGNPQEAGNLQEKELIEKFQTRLPESLSGLDVRFQTQGNNLILDLHHEELRDVDVSELIFYAADEGVVESGADQHFEKTESGLRITLRKSVFAGSDIQSMRGVLYNPAGWNANGTKAITVTSM